MEMLANDLTQDLIRECDERRIKSNEFDSDALAASGSSQNIPHSSDDGSQKGKRPKSTTVGEVKGDMHRGEISATTPSPSLSATDIGRTISGFVAAKSPQTPKPSPKPSPPMHDAAQNSTDIFSRGGSTPASRSPASSIAPHVASQLSPDSETPSLPFKQQHRILTTLQSILECAYYDFAQKHYPNLLIQRNWDCPEAGEITQWARGIAIELRQDPTNIKEARDLEGFISTLKNTDEIRHAAVHRIPVTGKDIQRLIENSRAVMDVLGDKRRRREIDSIGGVLERNIKTFLDLRREKEEKLRAELEKLEEWKRIIEIREMRAIRQADHEDERIEKYFRDEIEQALDLLETKQGGADTESVGSDKEPEPAYLEPRVKDKAPDHQDEEYYHDSEFWPAVGG